jgi:hypothetical protein
MWRTNRPDDPLDSRSVDRVQAEAMLAAISRVLPACEAESRQRFPGLTGKPLESEAFRIALRNLDLTLSYELYRYIKWRLEENRSTRSTIQGDSQNGSGA